jgi:hypothetical protein
LPRGFYIDPVDHLGHIAHHSRPAQKPHRPPASDEATRL